VKTTISRAEYLQLVGLLTLAEQHNERLQEIDLAVGELLEVDRSGHIGDEVYGGQGTASADRMLKNLGIAVAGGVEGVR
jgi:hypothetical protein